MSDDLIVSGTGDFQFVVVEDTITIIETISEPTTIIQLEYGPQGPKGDKGDIGLTGAAGAGLAPAVYSTLSPNQEFIMSQLDSRIYRSAKWLLTLSDPNTNRFRCLEILGLNRDGVCSHVIYGIIGNQFNYTVTLEVINNLMTLSIINGEQNSFYVGCVRIGSLAV